MARTALKEPQLKSWEAVNQTLADIADIGVLTVTPFCTKGTVSLPVNAEALGNCDIFTSAIMLFLNNYIIAVFCYYP